MDFLRKVVIYNMAKEITVKDVENVINSYTSIEEPIIVKRDNKEDLIIISMEEFRKMAFLHELDNKLLVGEEDIKNGRVYSAREVFEELGEEYGF